MTNPLVSLDFKVQFSTGKVIQGAHVFNEGLSSITGKNEAGKSLRLEMIRFALFGTAALRAEAKAYKNITTALIFNVGGKSYSVIRGSKVLLLGDNNIEIATGTTPVNNAVKKLLGYDLEVFDIANACLQGQIEAMTDKKPTERKQMVDRTIGLNAIDEVIKKVAEDSSATKAAIETLNQKVIQIFEAPVKPEGLDESKTIPELEAYLAELEAKNQRKSYLQGLIFSSKCEEPIKPVIENEVTEELDKLNEELQGWEIKKANAGAERLKLQTYDNSLLAIQGYDLDYLDTYYTKQIGTQWNNYNSYVSKMVSKPEITKEEIEFIRSGLRAKKHRNESCVDITCPNCNTPFLYDKFNQGVDASIFDEFKFNQISGKFNNPTEADLFNYERALSAYEAFTKIPVVDKPEMVYIPDPHATILAAFTVLKTYKNDGFDADKVRIDLTILDGEYVVTTQLLKSKIALKKSQQALVDSYNQKVLAYQKYQTVLLENSRELQQLEADTIVIPSVKDQLAKHRLFNDAKIKYEARQQAQAEALKTKAELEINLTMLGKVKKALTELKPKVKTHLLPSLNSVASQLLSEMTGGERNKIVVDENFEIEVDGQHIKTLSGSGKAVANLAVRIGLGMVLTNKKFSVFLADEIDAAMDDERAAYTAQCLRNLTNTINQIILVSHKQPDADHQIIL